MTSAELITAAYESGDIDRATALLYRLQATAGDDRLPAGFRGAGGLQPAEDDGADALVVAEWSSFSDEERAALLPYVVRPTDPASIYALPGVARSAFTLASTRAPASRTAAACEGGFLREQVPGIPVVVWGQCGGSSESTVLRQVGEVATYIADLWVPMTDLMGEPIGDANVPDDDLPDAPEAGDGLLDIYVVAGTVGGRPRELSTVALATTHTAAPLAGPSTARTSSSYIVVDGTAGSGLALKSTLAHELFHSLQFAHNNIGMTVGSASRGWDRHWFVEASATWAEHEFVPEARETEVYPRFAAFQESWFGLGSTFGLNEYASWVWPYFMRQEEGPEAIGRAWRNLEGVSGYSGGTAGYQALHRALDEVVSFADNFSEFAVRAYNLELEPGDPIDPRFQADDPSFPEAGPVDPRARWDVELAVGDPVEFREDMPGLWTRYVDLVTDGTPTVTFDFEGLGATDVGVELLVKLDDGWQRRDGTIGKVCDAERVVVVLANRDPDPARNATGRWSAQGSDEGCADGNWTVTLTGDKAGAGTYSGTADRIECFEFATGDWSFSVDLDLSGDIRDLSGNTDSLLIITRWAMDDPVDWGAGFQRGSSVTVTGDKSTEPWTVHAEATWQDPASRAPLASSVDVICSEWYSMVP